MTHEEPLFLLAFPNMCCDSQSEAWVRTKLGVNYSKFLQACSQRAGVKFLKHNVRDEFDDITDIARLYRIKNVPCFVFISGGAMVSPMLPVLAAPLPITICMASTQRDNDQILEFV